jgi:hypothetical protein
MQLETDHKFLKNNRNSILLFASLFAFNCFLSLQSLYPFLSNDEIYVISQSAHFAGLQVPLMGTFYYGYFQAFLYTPLFWLLNDPIQIYHGMLIINSIEASLVAVIAYQILIKYFNAPPKSAMPIAIVSGLFPALVLVAKIAWNETILYLLIWLILLIIIKELFNDHNKKQKNVSSVLLALFCVLSYGVHNRAILYCIAVFIFLITVLIIKKKQVVNLLLFFVTFFILLGLFEWFGRELKSSLWVSNLLTNSSETEIFNIQLLAQPNAIRLFLLSIIGNVYNVFCNSFGLSALGFVECLFEAVKWIKNRGAKQDKPECNVGSISFFILLLFAGAVLISSLFYLPSYINGLYFDRMLTTRYIDNISSILIFWGLYLVWQKKKSIKRYVCSLLIYLVTVFLYFRSVFPLMKDYQFNTWQGLSGSAFMNFGTTSLLSTDNLIYYSIFTFSVCVLLISMLYIRKKLIYFSIISTLFIYSNVFTYFDKIQYCSASSYNSAQVLNRLLDNFSESEKKETNFYFDKETGARSGYIYASLFKPYIYSDYLNFDITKNSYKNTVYISDNMNFTFLQKPNTAASLLEYGYNPDLRGKVTGFNDCYMLVHGDALIQSLKAKGYKLDYNNFSILSQLKLMGNGTDSGDAITLNDGGTQFGPYVALVAGKYQLIVQGSGLSHADFYISANAGAKEIKFTIKQYTENQTIYEFEITDDMIDPKETTKELSNVEFVHTNHSDYSIRLNEMKLKMIE